MARSNDEDVFSLHAILPKRPPFGSHEGLVEDESTDSNAVTGSDGSKIPQTERPSRLPLVLPACFTDADDKCDEILPLVNTLDLNEYFRHDLEMRTFDGIQEYLWSATRYNIVEALNELIGLSYSVAISEQSDQHLVSKDQRLYIKPLPEYLLCYSVWESHLCKEEKIYASALGLLRSYFYLVRSKSDLTLAHQASLIPTEITWQQWTSFTRAAFPKCARDSCHPRYKYGVLGASDLTWLLRLCPETRSFRHFRQQWMVQNWTPSGYVRESTKWLLGALVYITVALTAMQVGLATDRLHGYRLFQEVSFGLTIFSILAPLAVLFVVLSITVTDFVHMLLILNRWKRRSNHNLVD